MCFHITFFRLSIFLLSLFCLFFRPSELGKSMIYSIIVFRHTSLALFNGQVSPYFPAYIRRKYPGRV